MNKFLNKSTCEKLVKLGLKSESGFWWTPRGDAMGKWSLDGGWNSKKPTSQYSIPAFEWSDFTIPSEYARENCFKLNIPMDWLRGEIRWQSEIERAADERLKKK